MTEARACFDAVSRKSAAAPVASPAPAARRRVAVLASLRLAVPYSGSVRPRIRVLEPGHAEVEIPDRRANRQHLGSVHAIALLNVAEQASGLALLTGLPDGIRGIVTQISMQYFKKARGTIRAVCRTQLHRRSRATRSSTSSADCLDRDGTVVARATVRWRLGPVR